MIGFTSTDSAGFLQRLKLVEPVNLRSTYGVLLETSDLSS